MSNLPGPEGRGSDYTAGSKQVARTAGFAVRVSSTGGAYINIGCGGLNGITTPSLGAPPLLIERVN